MLILYQSKIFLAICISFCFGVFLHYFTAPVNSVLPLLILAALAQLLIFWRNIPARAVVFCIISFLLGIYYPVLLNREKLIVIDPNSYLITGLNDLRLIYTESLARVLPEPQASLASGLVVGTKGGFPLDLKDAFIRTGTIHITAVSGFNITVVLSIFSEYFKFLGRKIAFASGTAAIILFIVLVGGQASVVRAGIMGWLFLLAKLVYRLPNIKNALFLTATVMIIFEPKIISNDIGFQLSFISMLGLIYISPIFNQFLVSLKYTEYIPKIITISLRETLAAQIAVSLLILGYFSRLSIIAPLTNILIVPILPFPMIMGIIIGLLSAFNLNGVNTIAVPLDISLRYILNIVEIFNKFSFTSVNIHDFTWSYVLFGYCAIIIFIYILNKKYVNKI